MSINIKRRTIKIVIAIIVLILAIVGGIYATQIIITNNKISATAEKLKEINVSELENKIIERLKETDLYVEEDTGELFVGTMIGEGTEIKDYITVAYIAIKNGNGIGAVEVPVFKINTDSHGKFKNIEYLAYETWNKGIVEKTIKNIFKEEYDIDFSMTWGMLQFNGNFNGKYNKTFDKLGYTNKGDIYYVRRELFWGNNKLS